MSLLELLAFDLVAITILTFVVYFPRHRRRDMLVALLVINVGVLAVTQAMSSAGVTAGLGLGLFGVLSIIRLRSAEMAQSEVAYYFAALTLGLLGGFAIDPRWLGPVLMAAIVIVVVVGDHPRLFGRYRHQMITLDRAITDESVAYAYLESLLGAPVKALTVLKVNLVDDTTVVDVRYELPRSAQTSLDIDDHLSMISPPARATATWGTP